jgi:predicted small integral membrane protein
MLSWMHWTNQSLIIILVLVGLITMINIINLKYPNHIRKGVLPITTTRGERFFIALLCTIFFWFLWFKYLDIPIYFSYIFVIPFDFIIMKWA